MIEPFCYRFTVGRVVDGDTIDGDIDLGFQTTLAGQRLRLLRVNTPERKGPTKKAGDKAKVFTMTWLASRENVLIRSRKRAKGHDEKDAFGRYLVEVWATGKNGQECLNDALLESGNAIPFMEDA